MSRWPDRAGRAETWDQDPEMRQLGEVGQDLATLRRSYEDTIRPLLERREQLALSLLARGALVAEVAARAGVSDSLMSRLVKRARQRARARP